MSEWTTQRLEEIIQVNPTVKLTKGEVYPFIDIDKVSPTLRSVTNEEENYIKKLSEGLNSSDLSLILERLGKAVLINNKK